MPLITSSFLVSFSIILQQPHHNTLTLILIALTRKEIL